MDLGKLIGFLAVAVCLIVLVLPDQRDEENFRRLFSENGMELLSIEPSSGCYRVGSYRYEARNQSGNIERGHLCVNKSMQVLEWKSSR